MLSKEEIRQRRKDAYQKAKAKRDADPRYHALKERMKEARKAKYQAFKEQKKKTNEDEKNKKRAAKDESLRAFFVTADELEKKN